MRNNNKEELILLHPHKSMGPDGIHPRVLREVADIVAGPLSIIFEMSWRSGQCHTHLQEGPTEGPGNYRPISLTSSPGKVME